MDTDAANALLDQPDPELTPAKGDALQDVALLLEADEHEELETMAIVCPEGVAAGEALTVISPGGVEVEVLVPEGIAPGEEFEVTVSTPRKGGADEGGDAAGTETLAIVCPEGVGPGEALEIETAGGNLVEVLVPEGVSPGEEFEVAVQL
jgi:hypothetical protein